MKLVLIILFPFSHFNLKSISNSLYYSAEYKVLKIKSCILFIQKLHTFVLSISYGQTDIILTLLNYDTVSKTDGNYCVYIMTIFYVFS